MRAACLFLATLGCRPGKVGASPGVPPTETGSADTSGQGSTDTSPPLDTSPSIDTSPAADTAPPVDTAPSVAEDGVDFSWSDGLCQVALSCDGPIVDSPKVGCDMAVVDGYGTTAWNGRAGLEIRGRSSADFPKAQYGVELWDDADSSTSADLLGMGRGSDWVLNGAWIDRALFRNKLTYDLFQAIGGDTEYGPESRFCELTLNDEYWGIYLLAERVKADASRIDLADADVEAGNAFVLKLDESAGFIPNDLGYGSWTAISPRQADASDAAKTAIRESVHDWFQAATGSTPADPDTGIFAYVDLDSAVDFVIMEEFAKNNDAYYLSVHLWKDVDGKIHFVPWDIDLGYGQPSYNNNEPPSEWVLYRPAMISTFTLDPAFQARLSERWAELRADELSESAIQARIDGYETVMGDAIDRNFERWPIEDVDFYGYLYPVSSYDEELGDVRTWIDDRLDWMDANIDAY